jgi:hypothetical protein
MIAVLGICVAINLFSMAMNVRIGLKGYPLNLWVALFNFIVAVGLMIEGLVLINAS